MVSDVDPNDRAAEPSAPDQRTARILVVAHKTAATPLLLAAVRERAQRGSAVFHLLLPNPAEHAEITESERRRRHAEGEQMLALARPLIEQAAAGSVAGTVSLRHDPMDAIDEILRTESFDEIILSTLPHTVSRWLHLDLPHRVAHFGLPVTTITPDPH